MHLDAPQQLGVEARAVHEHVAAFACDEVGSCPVAGLAVVAAVVHIPGPLDAGGHAVDSFPQLPLLPRGCVDGVPAWNRSEPRR